MRTTGMSMRKRLTRRALREGTRRPRFARGSSEVLASLSRTPCIAFAAVLLAGCLAVLLAGCLTGCSGRTDTIRVGVNSNTAFSHLNKETGEWEGFEVDVGRELAMRITDGDGKVQFVGISISGREAALDDDIADMMIASYTITEERAALYNISAPYYTDAVKVLVRQDSGLTDLADLDGKTIGTLRNSASASMLLAEAAELGIQVFISDYDNSEQVYAAVLAGVVDGFVSDTSILLMYLDGSTSLIEEPLASQDYGIVTRKDNDALAQQVDEALAAMKADGTLAEIATRWGVS